MTSRWELRTSTTQHFGLHLVLLYRCTKRSEWSICSWRMRSRRIPKAAISLYGTQTACPVCRNCIDETDIMPFSGYLLFIYESLQVKCSHSQCNLKISLKNVKFHEISCQHLAPVKVFDVNKPHYSKLPLDQVSTKHIKHRRPKPVINSVQQKKKTKLMFFFLY